MRRTLGAALALVSVFSAAPAAAAEPGYVELAMLPGGAKGSAVDVNDAGVVVGRSTNAEGKSRPVRWDAEGRISELVPPAGATPGKVFGVDADGAAYGNTSTPVRNSQATRWNPDGSTTVLDLPPGDTYSFAVAVNDSGTVVGYSGDYATGVRRAVRWDRDGTATALPGLAPATEATAIDEAGAIAGTATTADDLVHYVRWDDGVLTVLGVVPDATYSSVADVNGRYVVGRIQRGDRTGFGLRWDGTALGEVPTPTGYHSFLHAVDAEGAAYGQVKGRPVKWSADGAVSVMALPDGYGAGEVLELNDRGVAAGTAISRYNRPIRWSSSGEVALLPVPSGTYGFAQGINDRGVVVGEYGGRPLLWP
ncbi:hypothetical protein [Saccharothrix luteola]|uniref:hypothetical protein n=1 Tax=Saccharothrix luteola TaxID=2893018 RepID=UPI001E656041|nr:hypothetical protein [Saccharothrix luteola]MCC8250367.1 hypothetical protein [Saccharothrix luteola]